MPDPKTSSDSTRPFVLNTSQVACLASATRREVFESLMSLGASSIEEMASYLGRSAKSLYYHIHALETAGLVTIHSSRPSGKRMEALYAVKHDRISLARQDTSSEYRRLAARSHLALMHRLKRELQMAEAAAETSGEESVRAVRIVSWLAPRARAELDGRLEEIARFIREHETPREGKRTTVTVFLTTAP